MNKPAGANRGGGLQAIDGVLVAPAPAVCDDRALQIFKTDVLAAVHAASARGVVIDVSRLDFLDTVMFASLADTARTLELLGARTVFVGFQPGVVSALVDMDVACDALQAAATLEDALDELRPAKAPTQAGENGAEWASDQDAADAGAATGAEDA